MLKEFKDFLIKGNAVDLAIWFIFWGAFATVIKSLVDNVIMPPVGRLMAWVDFSDLFLWLTPAAREVQSVAALIESGEPAILYGQFLNDVISFIILWFVVFMFVRTYNKMKEPAPNTPTPPTEVELLTQIRDQLAK